jgi:hypothetical protein
LTPRALHSLNVFLIKLTSFPILIAIALYERNFATGQSLRASSKGAAQIFFNGLPRRIKNIPIFEALVGSSSSDLYNAIFDAENSHSQDFDLFDEDDDNTPALRSLASRESLKPSTSAPGVTRKPSSPPGTPPRERRTPQASPKRRMPQTLSPLITLSADVPSGPDQSPLSRLFRQRPAPEYHAAAVGAEASVRRVEALLDDIRDLPVNRLKDDMKELQV